MSVEIFAFLFVVIPGIILGGDFIQLAVALMSGGGNTPLLYCLQHRAARFLQMRAVVKPAAAYVWPKLREAVLQRFLLDRPHLGQVKGGKARRIRDSRVVRRFKQLNVPGGMSAPAKSLADLSYGKMQLWGHPV